MYKIPLSFKVSNKLHFLSRTPISTYCRFNNDSVALSKTGVYNANNTNSKKMIKTHKDHSTRYAMPRHSARISKSKMRGLWRPEAAPGRGVGVTAELEVPEGRFDVAVDEKNVVGTPPDPGLPEGPVGEPVW